MTTIPREKLFFVDETGSNLTYCRPTAWGPTTERVVASKPSNKGKNITTIAALTIDGIVGGRILESPLNQNSFELWVLEELVPHLRPGDVVVLDNCRPHAATAALEAIEHAQAFVLFLTSLFARYESY